MLLLVVPAASPSATEVAAVTLPAVAAISPRAWLVPAVGKGGPGGVVGGAEDWLGVIMDSTGALESSVCFRSHGFGGAVIFPSKIKI